MARGQKRRSFDYSIVIELYLACQTFLNLLNIASARSEAYAIGMTRALFHPTLEQIELTRVLDGLSDPIRLAIVMSLAGSGADMPEVRCGEFGSLAGKSNLTYHFAKLRDAGVIRVRLAGTSRYAQLRKADLNTRFPGLIDAVIESAVRDLDAAGYPARVAAVPFASPGEDRRRAAGPNLTGSG